MKIYISADIEGVSGIVLGKQTTREGFDYERARKLMTGEVAAAAKGAIEAGADEIAFIYLEMANRVFLEKIQGVLQQVHAQCVLLKGLLVHEDEAVPVPVEVLHIFLLDDGLLHLVFGVKGMLKDRSGLHVFQLCPDKSPPLAGFHKLEFHNIEKLIPVNDGHSVFEIVG